MPEDDWPLIGDCGDTECMVPKSATERHRDVLKRINAFAAAVTDTPYPGHAFANGGVVGKTWPMPGNEAAFREQLRQGLASLPFWGGTP